MIGIHWNTLEKSNKNDYFQDQVYTFNYYTLPPQLEQR
jgi:hypothetical protein